MNFRTTILLLVVLVAAAALYFVTSRDEPKPDLRADDESGQTAGSKLLKFNAADVQKVAIIALADGPKAIFERSGASDWRILAPVTAPADAFKVDDLVRELTELRTTGRTSSSGKGLDKPQYVVEVTTRDGKTTPIQIGDRSAVSDILYVHVGDTGSNSGEADIVSASIVEQLEKPASDYRKNRLLATETTDVEGVTITHGGQTLKLARRGNTDWDILEPKAMPGDTAQVTSLLQAVTGLSAVKFVSEEVKDPAKYGLDQPQMTVELTTTPPATQPSASAGAAPVTKPSAGAVTTIKFGAAQDFFKKNVYAVASPTGPVVSVAATSLDALKKTPLDLRDREVLDLDASTVSRIAIAVDKPAATQPTSQPAVKRELVLERRSETAATAPATTAPTTSASTAPTTVASTAPAATQPEDVKQTRWLIASEPKGDANDATVQSLLEGLRPLRAEKYLEAPATQPAAAGGTYVVKINTRAWGDEPAKEHVLTLTDPGAEGKLTGRLGELAFETDRAILEKLTAEFTPAKVEPAGPALPAIPGLPGLPGPAAPVAPAQ